MTTTYSSQAGLASFRPAPQPVTIYAAVVEWPDGLLIAPDLITARSKADMHAQMIVAISEVLDATDDTFMPEYRAAFRSSPGDYVEWCATTDDGPIITFYPERMV